MPIYAYKCESCGFAKDVLQKMSDTPLSECPSCGKPSFQKQVTAAGFQLKGSGWYVTDFRGGANTGGAAAPAEASSSSAPAASEAAPSTGAASGGESTSKPAASAAPAAATPSASAD